MADIITILGKILADKIDKKTNCRQGVVEIDKLTLHDLQETIKKGLKNRLEKSGFPNKEEIVKLMLSELGRNQALLTMMKM